MNGAARAPAAAPSLFLACDFGTQRIGVATRITSAQCTTPSYTRSIWSLESICVIEHGQVQARADLE